jgi:DNA-binding response OmpR family regulator
MQSLPQRLLVVEDDVTVARTLSRLLARAGSSVATVRSCNAARSLSQTFDVAILDLDLPDGNGVDLARALLSAFKVPSVLFFSGSTDTTLLARARCMGPVVAKSLGTSAVLELLAAMTSEAADAPQSGTALSAPARSSQRVRASSSRAR